MKRKLTKNMITIKHLQKYEVDLERINNEKLIEFKEKIKSLTDTRVKKKTTYKIWDVVVVVFLATLSNCNDWDEIREFANMKYTWLKSF